MRKLGMAVLASKAYVAYKRREMIQSGLDLTEEDREIIARVNSRISPSDTMFDGDVRRYFLVGLSGLRAIQSVLQHCPSLSVQNILDFPSGCGRVGRYLAVRFPGAKITACDLDTEMVDFCAKALGMTPVYSSARF